ncbi:MAG: TonB-dependent receptor [Myxococcota bacterium]
MGPSAQETPTEQVASIDDVEEIVVVGEAPITAASALTTSGTELNLRPLTRPGDVAEAMPGLFAVQHAGGGKANQYFVRGFDADHGTDLAIGIDGVPVNLLSHAHGQGYADLHWLVPEIVQSVDVRKGPYEVFDGDLATAGAIEIHLVDRVHESRATATYGMWNTARGLAITGLNRGATHAVLAGEAYTTDGPFVNPEDLVRFNGYGKVTFEPTSALRVSVGGTAYQSGWTGSGQVPLRAVESGALDPFGTEDRSEGGQSTRRNLYATAQLVPDPDQSIVATVWTSAYRLNLFSNFTFFAEDPVHGDEIEQEDDRSLAGFDGFWRDVEHAGPFTLSTRFGVQGRQDRVDPRLYHDEKRRRLETVVDAHVDEASLATYVREEIGFHDKIRLAGGARLDHYTFAVDDRLDLPGDGVSSSGVRDAALVSPKANLVVSPDEHLDLFVNYGRGFHSNDARGVVLSRDPVDPLTVATGYELGARVRSDLGEIAASAWGLDLDAETVWVGDEGTTELRGPTHRQGLDVSLRAHPLDWLYADLDVTLSRSTYVDNAGNGDAVALAPPFTLAGGIGIDHVHGFGGGARVRHLSSRPATEDGSLTAEGFTIVDADATWRWHASELGLQVNNVLGTAWKEVQFANESQRSDEPAPVEDIHFTPGWPRTILASVTVYR